MSLYIVATPIGNREDISQRALKVLANVDLIAAEDTRHSRPLLQHYLISTPLVAYHDHNESHASDTLIEKLEEGLDVALISDAGTPLISDPGYRIVKLAQEKGIEVVPIPGPSALLAALCVAGLPTDRFHFEGFLPSKKLARCAALKKLAQLSSTLIFYESPHRIEETLKDMVAELGAERSATISRELTKKFEQIAVGTLSELHSELVNGGITQKGEFVVIVEGSGEMVGDFDERFLMSVLMEELPLSKAAAIGHKLCGAGKKHLYNLGLEIKS